MADVLDNLAIPLASFLPAPNAHMGRPKAPGRRFSLHACGGGPEPCGNRDIVALWSSRVPNEPSSKDGRVPDPVRGFSNRGRLDHQNVDRRCRAGSEWKLVADLTFALAACAGGNIIRVKRLRHIVWNGLAVFGAAVRGDVRSFAV
jgi:hypothetical protein